MALFFFFNDTATTEIYTLSLHDALPIFPLRPEWPSARVCVTSSVLMADEPTGRRRSSDGPVSGCRASGHAERPRRSVPRPRADGRRRGLGPSTIAIARATPRPAG